MLDVFSEFQSPAYLLRLSLLCFMQSYVMVDFVTIELRLYLEIWECQGSTELFMYLEIWECQGSTELFMYLEIWECQGSTELFMVPLGK